MTDEGWSRSEEVRELAEEHTKEELEQLRRDIEAEIPGATDREASLLKYRRELVTDAIKKRISNRVERIGMILQRHRVRRRRSDQADTSQ